MAVNRNYPLKPATVQGLLQCLSDPDTTEKQKRAMQLLVARMIEIFEDNPRLDYMNEIALISEISTGDEYRNILTAFSNAMITGTEDGTVIHQKLLANFTIVLRRAKFILTAENADHGMVLDSLRRRLDTAVRDAVLDTQYHLVCMIRCVIDSMVDLRLGGIDRAQFREPLLVQLDSLSEHSEPHLAQASRYAYLGLLNIADNETAWQGFRRNSWMILQATANAAGAIATLDPSKVTDAVPSIFKILELFKQIVDTGKELVYLSRGGHDVFTEAMRSARGKNWYLALRYTGMLIEARAFQMLKALLEDKLCDDQETFLCGVYAQLEQLWVAGDEPTRRNVEEVVESTLPRALKSKRTVKWVNSIGTTMNIPEWTNHKAKSRFSKLIFWDNKGECKPQMQLKISAGNTRSNRDMPTRLLEAAWQSCHEARMLSADIKLTQYYETGRRLEIVRLSGEQLRMDECYINLSIIESKDMESREGINAKKSNIRDSEFSILKRLKVQAPSRERELELSTLFDTRTKLDKTFSPRRILIRGRAGVGKTTLCKKIVHDFIHGKMWSRSFDRIVWIPLRRLRGYTSPGAFLCNEIFACTPEKEDLFSALEPTMWDDTQSSQTLFLLDGLDEISRDHRESAYGITAPLLELLNRRTVIITSRPYGISIPGLNEFDMELETVGFRPHEVELYIEGTIGNGTQKSDQERQTIQSMQKFISEHWLIQGLVRIPIQLDAFCFTWEDGMFAQDTPDNMTSLYEAIELKLSMKDIPRVKQDISEADAQTLRTRKRIEQYLGEEIAFLEALAFAGLYNDTIEFNRYHRDQIGDLGSLSPNLTESVLEKLSFLRAIDSSTTDGRSRDCYFIHLTFQEFFAARYFVRHWQGGSPMTSIQFSTGRQVLLDPNEFIQNEKYNERYDIMWRFVTGLLQADCHVLCKFLHELQAEPRDLLGITHLRLMMHCFSEISHADEHEPINHLRAWMERELARFVLSENHIRQVWGGIPLGSEVELSERLLHRIFDKGSYPYKKVVIDSLARRIKPAERILRKAILRPEHNNDVALRCAVARAVGHHLEAVPDMVSNLMGDPDHSVSDTLIDTIACYPNLPEAIIFLLVSHLPKIDVWRALMRQANLSPSVAQDLVAFVKHPKRRVRIQALLTCISRPALMADIIEDLAVLLDDTYFSDDLMRGLALQRQPNLPQELLKSLAARLAASKETNRREHILVILESQETLPIEAIDVLESMPIDDRFAFSAWAKHMHWNEGILMSKFTSSKEKDKFAITITKYLFRARSAVPHIILMHCVSLIHADGEIAWDAAYALSTNPYLAEDILHDLIRSLNDPHRRNKGPVALVVGGQNALSESNIEALFQHIDEFSSSWRIQRCLVNALGVYPTLPPKILAWIVSLLYRAPYHCATALFHQTSLSIGIIKKLIPHLSYLNNPGDNPGTRHVIEKVIRNRQDFYTLLKELSSKEWTDWLRVLREKSFMERITCYVKDGHLHVETSEGSWKVDIRHPDQQRKLRIAIQTLNEEMDKILGDDFDMLDFPADTDEDKVYIKDLDMYI
ncbi:hypothetical protein BDV39DRAFT_202613 [Aspergillus sergii]|uniref:NACHT domain-containing protein n=1 Tax=Aspergillus sergii TaxID=1034303 RepID=A0A5N6XD28_9EURO|nr:hypothetical protein BDV39DRAFT_202613 [Aspergillus sergii]